MRVLVVGDSYTFGFGNLDPDVRWWRLLEEELNRRTFEGAFAVYAIAEQGASTMEQARWLTSGVLDALDPHVVVVGYVTNDPVASPVDIRPGGLCGPQSCEPRMVEQTSEFRECLAGNDLSVEECQQAVQEALPHLVVDSGIDADPRLSPYFDEFRAAIERIALLTGPRPVLWAPLSTSREEVRASDLAKSMFESAGYRPVRMTRSQDLLSSEYGRDLDSDPVGHTGMGVHPGDPGHPGPLLTYAFARDVADAVLQVAPPGQAEAGSTSSDPPRSVLTSVLPLESEVDATTTGLALIVPADSWAPCIALGRPHVRVTFDRELAPGTEVSVSTSSEQAWDVYSTGYGASGEPVEGSLGVLSANQPVLVTTSPSLTGLLLAPVGFRGCPATGKWTVPEVSLKFDVQ